MHYRRFRIEGATYFFTVVTHERRLLFNEPQALRMLADATARVRDRHPFEIVAQVVLPDHLHAIWTLPEGDASYATRWRLIKEGFTRAHCGVHGSPERTEVQRARGEQPVWQRRFWEHTIRDERDFEAHLDYIHLNPVMHGLVTAPKDWPNSTFADWVERGVYSPTWGSNEKPRFPGWEKSYE